MKWAQLLPTLAELIKNRSCPDALVIHLGENDLVQLSGLGLIKEMKKDLDVVARSWAGTCIILTALVPRRIWRGALNCTAVERGRRKVNREMRRFCSVKGLCWLEHKDIVRESFHLYRPDGVHLSFLGNEFYLLELRNFLSGKFGVKFWA